LPGPCSFCPANCCKSYTITVTVFDVLRAAGASGKKPEEFAVLDQARLLAFDPDTTLDMRDDGWVYLLGFRSHPCAFVEGNRCAIHASAPLSCRRYPFQLNGTMNTRCCPLTSQLIFRVKGADLPVDPLIRELALHKRIVKEWNKKPGKKSECLAFLLKRAKELTGTSSG
jgi:Fe-S-cluster containining protein